MEWLMDFWWVLIMAPMILLPGCCPCCEPCDDPDPDPGGDIQTECCENTIPDMLTLNLTNISGCGSFSEGGYDLNYDESLSNSTRDIYTAYLSESFRLLLYCTDLGQSDRLYLQHQCYLDGQWRDAIGATFRQVADADGLPQQYDCEPFLGYVDSYQVQKITYINGFGFTVEDNCCGDVTNWTFDVEITE